MQRSFVHMWTSRKTIALFMPFRKALIGLVRCAADGLLQMAQIRTLHMDLAQHHYLLKA